MIYHKDWDINEHATGRFKDSKPIKGVTFQNGLNDKNPDGSFSPCDMGITEEANGVTYLKAKRGRWGQVRFGDSSHPNSFLVKIKDKGLKGLSFKYTGGNGASMTANNGKPLCTFDNGISIESTPKYNGVKIDIIVDDPVNAPTIYPFSVKTYRQNYTFTEYPDGCILAMGDDDKAIHFQPPYAIDVNGDIGAVHYNIIGTVGGYWLFEKIVDEAWLRQAAAPVRIDPDVTIEDGVDGGVIEDSIANGGNNGNWGAATFLQVNTGQTTGLLIRVNLSSYSGITVINAKYTVNVTARVGSFFTNYVYPILRQWNEGNKTGGAASTGEVTGLSARHNEEAWTTANCAGSGTDHDSTAIASFVRPASNGNFDIDLDVSGPQAKIDNPSINYGDVVRDIDGSSGDYWRCDSSEGTIQPTFYMEYTEVNGAILSRRGLGRGLMRGLGRGF